MARVKKEVFKKFSFTFYDNDKELYDRVVKDAEEKRLSLAAYALLALDAYSNGECVIKEEEQTNIIEKKENNVKHIQKNPDWMKDLVK